MDVEFSPLVEWLATFALESKVIIRSNFGNSFVVQWSVEYLLTHPPTPGSKSWEIWGEQDSIRQPKLLVQSQCEKLICIFRPR